MSTQIGKRILVFGAGNIGRSFIGQIFGRNGYQVVFADVDARLVNDLNEAGTYEVVHRYPDGAEERVTVPGVSAVNATDTAALLRALEQAPLVATSVGAEVLPRLLPILTGEALRRARRGEAPFDLILAENIHRAGDLVRDAVSETLHTAGFPETYRDTAPRGSLPGVVECSVGKMVPIVPPERRAQEPTTVWAEGFNTLVVDADGWSGDLPAVPELKPVRPIAAWVDRKLYIHNLGHAASAYLGFRIHPNATYIWEVLEDDTIFSSVKRVMTAAADALRLEYPGTFTDADLYDHIDDLLYRFSNRALGDTVFRVGRDVKRKLGPGDRIVGALRLLERHGVDTEPVRDVYRSALRFRAPDPSGTLFPADRELQEILSAAPNPEVVLAEISGFRLPDERDMVRSLLTADPEAP
jgi:mannitol-1-phosphate 5-dehydrogenase